MQSQHMILSSGLSSLEQPVRKDPPAMQEKMLTKLQTSMPTSQTGTTKPHGLVNTSTPVRTDPQRNSPNDVYTIHNYPLKLKSMDGRDQWLSAVYLFDKKVDPPPPGVSRPQLRWNHDLYMSVVSLECDNCLKHLSCNSAFICALAMLIIR